MCRRASGNWWEPVVVYIFEQVKFGNRLRLITYGTANNDRKFVELQRCIMIGAVLFASNYCLPLHDRRTGVDAVCVDHVSYIRKSLLHERN